MRESRSSLIGLVLLVLAVAAAAQWWAQRNASQLGREVALLVRPGDIHMLSSDSCAVCAHARAWMKQHGVAFSECSIERDATCAAAFAATQAPGTPVLMVRGKPMLGFNPQRLRDGLQRPV